MLEDINANLRIPENAAFQKLLPKDNAQQLFADVSCAFEAARAAVVTALVEPEQLWSQHWLMHTRS